MDPQLLGGLALALGLALTQTGWFDDLFSSSDDDAEEPDPEPTEADLNLLEEPDSSPENNYDPGAYIAEVTGTDAADTVAGNDLPLGQAFLLEGGNDSLDASAGDDYADGGAGDDMIEMRQGDDIAFGNDGNDNMDGGIGFDTLFGGAGNDMMTGNGGDDSVYGDDGDDTLTGSGGADLLMGGAGNDVLFGDIEPDAGDATDGADTLLGGEGDDTINVAGYDTAIGGDGADQFYVYASDPEAGVAQINDFTPGEDVVAVFYSPLFNPDSGDPVLSLAQTAAGDGTMLSLNGIEIGLVLGGQTLTVNDIALVPMS